MPKSREHEPARIKEHLSQRGKEQITNVDNSRTDEKMVTTKPEAEKTEAPKKKKNIIRVYHAQNASDGGKNRPKRPASDKKPAARPQQKPQAVKPAEPVQQKPAAEAAPKKPQAAAPSETPETKKPTEIRQAHRYRTILQDRRDRNSPVTIITEDRTARIIVTEEIQAVTIVVEITEETVISVAEKKDFLIAMEIMDRVVRIVTEIVRPDHRVKVVRHVRVMEMAVR